MVLVWLGKENPSPRAERVFHNFIPRFLAVIEDEGFELFESNDPFCNDPALIRHLGEEICSHWRADWIDFFLFLVQCRWFRRGWVVQEVLLKFLDKVDQVIILCGSLRVLWIDLSGFLALLTELNWRATLTRRLRSHEATQTWDIHFSYMLQAANAVFQARKRVKEYCLGKTPKTLENEFGSNMKSSEIIASILFKTVTLMRKRGVGFSDKRDTIYGFLGLLSVVLPRGKSNPITADYSLSDVDVFTKAAWYMASNMPYLDVLSASQYNILGADHPSWVPDFSAVYLGVNFQRLRRSYNRPHLMPLRQSHHTPPFAF